MGVDSAKVFTVGRMQPVHDDEGEKAHESSVLFSGLQSLPNCNDYVRGTGYGENPGYHRQQDVFSNYLACIYPHPGVEVTPHRCYAETPGHGSYFGFISWRTDPLISPWVVITKSTGFVPISN